MIYWTVYCHYITCFETRSEGDQGPLLSCGRIDEEEVLLTGTDLINFTTIVVSCVINVILHPLLWISQFINTHIDPVCPDRLILRYCSWTLTCCTGEQSWKQHQEHHDWSETGRLAIMSLCLCQPIYLESYLVLKTNENNWPFFELEHCFVLQIISMSVFLYTIHHQAVIV